MTQAKKTSWLPLKANPQMRDPAHWTTLSDKPATPARQRLSPAGMRELGRLVKDGQGSRQIARAMGMAERNAGEWARRILAALKQPTESDKWLLFRNDVLRRFEAGQDRAEIARATGRSSERVAAVLREAGLRLMPRSLRLTRGEVVDVERRLRAGEAPALIATDLGCSPSAIWRRAKIMRLAGEKLKDTPERLCGCRRPLGHSGKCLLPGAIVDQIEGMLRDGLPNAEIARRVGHSIAQVRRVAAPILARLKAEGLSCVCGQELGHRGGCPHFSADTARLKADVARLLNDGMWPAEISRILGRKTGIVQFYARPILKEWAAEGRLCPCGKAINHVGRCSYRMAGREITRLRLRKVRVDLPRSMMRKIIYRLKKGWPASAIVNDLSIKRTSVAAVTKAFVAGGGRLPDQCRCGAARGHGSPCLRVRKARAMAPVKLAETLSPEQVRKVRYHYRKGTDATTAARLIGTTAATVRRRFDRLARTSRLQVRPCSCGRPARHHGLCAARDYRQLSPRWTVRIRAMLLDGQTVRQVADALHVEFNTVVRHAGDVRIKRFNLGLACECGREIGHPSVCSATWERHFGERKSEPLSPALIAKVAKPLLKGLPVRKIAMDAAVTQESVRRALRLLSADDRHSRAAAIRQRRNADGDMSPEAMMTKVERTVSPRLDASVREEVIADLYLAVVEGRLEMADLKEAARILINQSFANWANAYGPSSLDETLGRDSTMTRGELIADETSAMAVDEIEIGQPPP